MRLDILTEERQSITALQIGFPLDVVYHPYYAINHYGKKFCCRITGIFLTASFQQLQDRCLRSRDSACKSANERDE